MNPATIRKEQWVQDQPIQMNRMFFVCMLTCCVQQESVSVVICQWWNLTYGHKKSNHNGHEICAIFAWVNNNFWKGQNWWTGWDIFPQNKNGAEGIFSEGKERGGWHITSNWRQILLKWPNSFSEMVCCAFQEPCSTATAARMRSSRILVPWFASVSTKNKNKWMILTLNHNTVWFYNDIWSERWQEARSSQGRGQLFF